MAEFKSVEFLGIGIAAIFVSIFWGGSVSVRALLAVAASVAALDLLRPLWRVPVRSKSMEKDDLSAESPPCSKAAVVASMSAIAASLRAALRSIARRAAGSLSVQVLSVVLAAFLISCGAKVLHIPGYPWNCLVLGVFVSRCSRRFAAERQQSEQSSEMHVDSCPYSPDFWKELGTIEMDEEEEEFPDDLGDTRKLMAKMGEKGASMKDDVDQEEEVSTEADKEDEEEDEEDDEEEEEEYEDYALRAMVDDFEQDGDGEVETVLEKLMIAYNLFDIHQSPSVSKTAARE